MKSPEYMAGEQNAGHVCLIVEPVNSVVFCFAGWTEEQSSSLGQNSRWRLMSLLTIGGGVFMVLVLRC